MVVEGGFEALADGVALPGQALVGAGRGGAAGSHGAGGNAAIEEAPVQLQSRGPVGALVEQLGDEGRAAAAFQADHRLGDHPLAIAAGGHQPQAGQQLGGAAIGLAQEGVAGGLQGPELGVVAPATHDGLLQIEGPGGLQPHRPTGPQADIEGDIDQVAELALSAQLQGLGLLEAVQALLQGGFGPEPVEPWHQTRLLQRRHLVAHHRVTVGDGPANALQLVGKLQAVVSDTHIQLQLAQPVGVALAGGPEAVVGLGDAGGAVGADQLPAQLHPGGGGTDIALHHVPALGPDQEGGARRIDTGVGGPHLAVGAVLAEAAGQVQAQLRPPAPPGRSGQVLLLAHPEHGSGQIWIVAHGHRQGLGQAEPLAPLDPNRLRGLRQGRGGRGRQVGQRFRSGSVGLRSDRQQAAVQPFEILLEPLEAAQQRRGGGRQAARLERRSRHLGPGRHHRCHHSQRQGQPTWGPAPPHGCRWPGAGAASLVGETCIRSWSPRLVRARQPIEKQMAALPNRPSCASRVSPSRRVIASNTTPAASQGRVTTRPSWERVIAISADPAPGAAAAPAGARR